jgi:hypothetical protein
MPLKCKDIFLAIYRIIYSFLLLKSDRLNTRPSFAGSFRPRQNPSLCRKPPGCRDRRSPRPARRHAASNVTPRLALAPPSRRPWWRWWRRFWQLPRQRGTKRG